MSGDPWRPDDIGDSILRRPFDLPNTEDLIGMEFDFGDWLEDVDEVFVMAQDRIVVFWPMRLHRHGQECRRA